MAETSTIKPFEAHRGTFTPLEGLVRSALTRSGNFSPSRIDGEVMMMMIELANRVIKDVRRHPYWTGGDIDYYNDQTQFRPIPDLIMIDGLTAHYNIQQGSEKAMTFYQLYTAGMSDILWDRYTRADGTSGNAPLCVSITDGGSNEAYKSKKAATSTTSTTTTSSTGSSTTTTSSGGY